MRNVLLPPAENKNRQDVPSDVLSRTLNQYFTSNFLSNTINAVLHGSLIGISSSVIAYVLNIKTEYIVTSVVGLVLSIFLS
mgnify:CR=1 FL=1